jgi:hypothetical protein
MMAALITVAAISGSLAANDMRAINISFADTKPLDHFWRSTGWCPPDGRAASEPMETYALQDASWLNHAWIAAVPNNGIKYVRVHDLVSLIEVPGTADPSASILGTSYNFSRLDAVVDLIVHEHGFVMGFELMGNPRLTGTKTGVYTNFKEPAQISNWYTLVLGIVQRYADKYGLATIQKFRWEPWNEPSHSCNSDRKLDVNIDCDVDAWLSYVNATEKALRAVGGDELVFGGPNDGGASVLAKPFFKSFLERANTGSIKSDYISWHVKGALPTGGMKPRKRWCMVSYPPLSMSLCHSPAPVSAPLVARCFCSSYPRSSRSPSSPSSLVSNTQVDFGYTEYIKDEFPKVR